MESPSSDRTSCQEGIVRDDEGMEQDDGEWETGVGMGVGRTRKEPVALDEARTGAGGEAVGRYTATRGSIRGEGHSGVMPYLLFMSPRRRAEGASNWDGQADWCVKTHGRLSWPEVVSNEVGQGILVLNRRGRGGERGVW